MKSIDEDSIRVPRRSLRRRLWRILKRNDIVLRQCTHQAQGTRHDQKVQDDWCDYITTKMEMLGITHDNLCNFDKTNVHYSPECTKTLNKKGERTISVLRAPSSQRCTIMLGVSGTGYKFPPYIIFKGQRTKKGIVKKELEHIHLYPKKTLYPTMLHYNCQAKAWMDTDLMLDWISKVLEPWARSKIGPTIILIDECSCHLTKLVSDRIIEIGGHLEFIPAGYTAKLQVLDVGLNKPFKDKIRDSYDDWFFLLQESLKTRKISWYQNDSMYRGGLTTHGVKFLNKQFTFHGEK